MALVLLCSHRNLNIGGMSMIKGRKKIINRNILSRGQNRLLRESLKQLLGSGLIHSCPQISEREQKAIFLKDALNPIALQAEWLA